MARQRNCGKRTQQPQQYFIKPVVEPAIAYKITAKKTFVHKKEFFEILNIKMIQHVVETPAFSGF